MGNGHAESIAHMSDSIVKYVADTNPSAAETLVKQWAPEATVVDPDELTRSPDLQAVVIATPTPFHYPQAKQAILAGKHVYLEIPMVRHVEEGEELAALAREKNVVLTIGHSLRGWGEYELIKAKVDGGAVGAPRVIRLGRRTPHPKRWYSNNDSSGGVILDAMVHEFDYLHWCFGKASRVFCRGVQGRMTTEYLDYALAIVRLQSGAIAHVESSWCHYGQFNQDVEVAGTKGVVVYDNHETVPLRVSFIDIENSSRQFFSESPVLYTGHYKLLRGFFQAVTGAGPNPVSPEDGIEAVRMAQAAIESVKTKQPVVIH